MRVLRRKLQGVLDGLLLARRNREHLECQLTLALPREQRGVLRVVAAEAGQLLVAARRLVPPPAGRRETISAGPRSRPSVRNATATADSGTSMSNVTWSCRVAQVLDRAPDDDGGMAAIDRDLGAVPPFENLVAPQAADIVGERDPGGAGEVRTASVPSAGLGRMPWGHRAEPQVPWCAPGGRVTAPI